MFVCLFVCLFYFEKQHPQLHLEKNGFSTKFLIKDLLLEELFLDRRNIILVATVYCLISLRFSSNRLPGDQIFQ